MLAPMDLAILFGVASVLYGPKGPGPGSGIGSGAAKRPPLLDERIVKWLDSWRRFHFIWIGSLIATSCYLGSVPPALSAEIKSTAQQEKVALSNEAAIALRQRNYKLAVEKQEAVLKIDRDDSAARRNLATALNCVAMEETTSPTEAINCFHKALFWSPYNSTSLIHLNECIRQSGKNPDDFTTRSNLGDKARKQADFMGAIVEYQQALKIKDDPKIRERLGDVFMLRDQTHEALAEYLGGWRIKPTASLAVKIGQTYQASGDIHNAILFYDEARELPEESTDEAVEAGWERALKEGRSRPAVNQENE